MVVTLLASIVWMSCGAGEPAFPQVQVVPLPTQQFGFEVGGIEAARYHYAPSYHRPFVFPVIGPAGRPVTRLTHPHDPDGHGHHLSVWVAHQSVNGANFWENGVARIVHDGVVKIVDGDQAASLTVRNQWQDGTGQALVTEERTVALHALQDQERYLDLTIELESADGPVTFGKTAFGFLGVRVAKTMSVNDGGGTIRNSEGGVGEKEIFWKPARWVDYTGRVTPETKNGIALFDHPSNPRHPVRFHVRNDGWMGPSFCNEEAFALADGETLTLRYRLYVHGPSATPDTIDAHWEQWAEEDG